MRTQSTVISILEIDSNLHVVPFYIHHKRTTGCQKYSKRARSRLRFDTRL